jgi:hypothetical protein
MKITLLGIIAILGVVTVTVLILLNAAEAASPVFPQASEKT